MFKKNLYVKTVPPNFASSPSIFTFFFCPVSFCEFEKMQLFYGKKEVFNRMNDANLSLCINWFVPINSGFEAMD